MTGKRDRGHRLALKCLFAVIGFSFFAVQVSYKFYVYSSRPVFQSAEKVQATGSSAPGHLISPKHRSGGLLSLDKRYDHKHIYELYIPPSRPVLQQSGVETIFYVSRVSPVSRENLFISLRGPPVS